VRTPNTGSVWFDKRSIAKKNVVCGKKATFNYNICLSRNNINENSGELKGASPLPIIFTG
jgi:hypothetical protein